MKTSLFLVSLLFGGSLFAQTATNADLGNSLLKKFNEESKQNAEAPPISFIENKGQIHDQNYKPRPDVLFGAMAGNMTFHLKTSGVSYQLTRVDSYKEVEDPKTNQTRKEIDRQTIYRVDLNWLNANSNLRTTTDQTLEGYNNYYLASCPDGALNVKSYTGVTVHNLYNGINLHYYEKEGQLKHDYIVAPGANYQQIQIKVEGATVRINEDGSLTLTTPLGKIVEGAPIVYQNGKQLKANWSLKNNTLGFEIENYNPNQELIIDPVTRAWGTYYGGTDNVDSGYSCTTDAIGNVFLAGQTGSSGGTVIATAGAHQVLYANIDDLFLVKFNTNGVRQWGTYYGGSGSEEGWCCTTDATGNVYLSGMTNSTTGTVIATAGSHQSVYGGSYDAFLVKFNTDGVRQWGTYYGGSEIDQVWSCSTDATGNVYMAGETASSTSISTAGSHQSAKSGANDAFLVKFDANGVRQWGTYYGGSGSDYGRSCATDASGNVYLAGYTSSNTGIASAGSHQPLGGGSSFDAFLVKFDATGLRQWGTYYGGIGGEEGWSCSIDATGNVYMAGQTASATAISTAGAHQVVFGGSINAFLVKFSTNGVRQWGTYYGVIYTEGWSCSNDAAGNVYLSGYTTSNTGTQIATAGAHQSVFGGGMHDAFLVKFNSDGVRQWGTNYGGSGNDYGRSCVTDAAGNVYMAGYSGSNTGAAIASAGSHQATHGGGTNDAFLVKFSDCTTPATPGAISGTTSICSGSSNTYSITAVPGATSYTWTLPGGWTGTSTTNSITTTASATSGNVSVTANNLCGSSASSSQAITVNTTPATPTITPSGSTAICAGGSVTLTSSSASGNQWYLGGTPIGSATNQNYVASTAGNFTVIVTAGSCVSTTSAATTVSVNPLDNAGFNYGATAYCDNAADPTSTVTGLAGGTFSSSPAGLSINASSGTIDVSASTPASYTVTYTTNGTCPNSSNVSVTINASTVATVNQTACDSYTWALNGTTYTTSGTYTHVGTNASGCPLTTTLNLTINNSTTATVSETACDSYTWALNGTTYTTSGTYTHVGTNASGCPLTTTLNLTINNSTTATVSETACDSYTWALNGTTYTTSGTYTHVGTNASGCPLTTTLNLTINNSTTATVTETACDSYTWALNGTTYTTSGTYTHVGTNASGCPLTTTLNLTINSSTTATVTQTACDSYTWALNGTTYSTSGTYTHVGTNASGCPLTTTLNLTINTVDLSTTLSGLTITANAVGASYQWIDCNNGNVSIPGETSQSYTATLNGNYAVIVSDANCTDTSACQVISSVGIGEHNASAIEVYPNPTSGSVNIILGKEYQNASIHLFNALGQVILHKDFTSTDEITFEIEGAPGVYFLEIESAEQVLGRIRVVKN